ncbi:dTDP-4-dehydrorhamnose 3,5-epimerase family protein [Candidatus Woesearchaeota archaeon]|nr:dTDP-4-dehydrorhamnose 3,5-epimerase family protein [Candidatus Woesearchaeota archaeon]
MIEGVKIKKLKLYKDERGELLEIFRRDDPLFEKFGQAYITTSYPGYVKGWHYHKVQRDNFCCVQGKVKVVLYDDREDSRTKGEVNEFILDRQENPMVLSIPPYVFHGFECASDEQSIILNVPTEPYHHQNPDEYRLPFNTDKIPYTWKGTKGG